MLAAIVGGCQTGPTTTAAVPPAASPPPADAMSPSRTALAFEPVVGIPKERAAALATALGSDAAAAKLPVVGRDKPDVRFRVKGYFSAAAEGTSTRVSYIWDIFDSAGARVHRITGAETVPAALPDPWSAVPDQTLADIASRTVADLRDWLDKGAPTTAVAGDPIPPEAGSSYVANLETGTRAGITETRAIAAGRGGRIPDAATLAPDGPAAIASADALPQPPRFTYYLRDIAGATGDGADSLAHALSMQLDTAGGARVAERADADYVITGEATVAPPVHGSQIVAIIWSVADGAGKPLGSVRQVAKFAQGALDEVWGTSADTAAASAAPGVLALMPQQ